MARYPVTYTCGHSGTVNLVGPHRARESRIAYLENGECFDCYKQKSTEVAREQAEELELPQLVGTEKQVAWAETLRIEKLNEIEEAVERLKQSKDYRQILVAVEHISNETSAKKWIDWHYDQPKYIISDVLKKLMSTPTEEQKRVEQEAREKSDALKRAAQVEATIRPENVVSELPVEISLNGATISVRYPEQDTAFKKIVKSLGYVWSNGQWERTISKFAGKRVDRVIEVGHTLLSRGFLVRIFDEELRAGIVAGVFEPEHTRWIQSIVKGDYVGWFCIIWNKQHEDYYDAARKIKNSKYSAPNVVVPSVQFAQVLDFAGRYDFRLSDNAQEIAQIAQADKEKMLVVAKERVALPEKTVASDKPPVLEVPETVEIDDELREAV